MWCLFLIYLAFSRFATLKLGGDHETPRYNDYTVRQPTPCACASRAHADTLTHRLCGLTIYCTYT